MSIGCRIRQSSRSDREEVPGRHSTPRDWTHARTVVGGRPGPKRAIKITDGDAACRGARTGEQRNWSRRRDYGPRVVHHGHVLSASDGNVRLRRVSNDCVSDREDISGGNATANNCRVTIVRDRRRSQRRVPYKGPAQSRVIVDGSHITRNKSEYRWRG